MYTRSQCTTIETEEVDCRLFATKVNSQDEDNLQYWLYKVRLFPRQIMQGPKSLRMWVILQSFESFWSLTAP